MCLGLKFQKKITFFRLSFFLFMSTNFIWANNPTDTDFQELKPTLSSDNISKPQESTEQKTSNIAITHRIIFNSFFETLWNYHKEFSHNSKKTLFISNGIEYQLELTDFCKIFSNLMVDEALPKHNPNLNQKLAEFFIPSIIAFIIVKTIKEKDFYKTHSSNEIFIKSYKLTKELFMKLLIKFIMVRCFLQPGTTKYKVANIFATLASFCKYNENATGFSKFICWKYGTIKLSQDLLKKLIDKANLGKTLNKKHQKKAMRKILQSLIEPFEQWALDNIENMVRDGRSSCPSI